MNYSQEFLDKNRQFFVLFCCIKVLGILALFFAVKPLPYSYYTFLRLFIFGISVYGVYLSVHFERIYLLVFYIITAYFFNPIFPVRLRKEIWIDVDFTVAIYFIMTIAIEAYPYKDYKKGS